MSARNLRAGSFLKYLVLTLPFVLLLLVSVEFLRVAIVYLREANNPYVAVIERGGPWPNAGSDSAYLESAPPAKLEKFPVPTLEEEYSAHAAYLLNQPFDIVWEYAHKYPRVVSIYPDQPTVDPVEFDPTSAVALPRAEQWLSKLTSTPEIPVTASPWKNTRSRMLSIEGDYGAEASLTAVSIEHADQVGMYVVLFGELPYSQGPVESPNDRPFFTFKRHGEPPSGSTYLGLPEFRLNNFGFRDDDSELPRPGNMFRAVCVGASTTMEGATNGFTYPNLAERFLKERFPGRAIEVVNCGIAGINTTGERARFADYLMLEPQAVVFLNGVNDICHYYMGDWRASAPLVPWMLLHSRFMRDLFDSWIAPASETMAEEFREGGQDNLLAMAKYAKQCGVTPYICTFPHLDGPNLSHDERVYYERDARLNWTGRLFTLDTYLRAIGVWNDQLRETCAKEGVALIDLAANLTGGGQVFGDICHMKDYGIEQKALLVAAALEPQVAAFFEAQDAQALP